MKRLVIAVSALSMIAAGTVAAVADGPTVVTRSLSAGATGGLRAGVGVVDATWHVGAGAGQYASDEDPTDASSEWDPNVEHVKQASSYGVASRLSIRAIVLQDGQGDPPVALVKVDNYLAQDMLTRRVAQILAADGSSVTYDNILMSATHDHNSPYYSTPAAGVWLFQDVMDLRMFEYQARQMATAIETAEKNMVPAAIGGTTVDFPDFQGNIAGSDVNEDGSPTGYPLWDNDHGLTLLRIDNVSDPASPKPLATYVNYAEHGESLDGYNLISGDWLAPFQRYMQQETGVPVVFSQGSVGSAEGPYEYANPKQGDDQGDKFYEMYGHMGYAQAERGTHLMAEKAYAAWQAIGGAANGIAVQAPMATDVPVKLLTHWVAGPVSHPYPSVGNCRTRQTADGDPGLPAAGLPDCARSGDYLGLTLPFTKGLFDQLKAAGAPIPDNYDVTSFGTVEEDLRIKLQALRIGGILLASCSCEPQSDLIKNLETRTDDVTGNVWLGFDYGKQADVDEGWPGMNVRACYPLDDPVTTYSCPDPRDRWGSSRLKVSKAAFDHMEAEINNDANGWNDPSYAAQANSEPTDLSQIKGNFTHTELGTDQDGYDYSKCTGYALTVGLGHTGDYNGYTVTYREYQARDAYRKALTSYGPHTADYMVTNLVGMAANLLCGTPLIAQPTDPIAAADEQRQQAEATVLGQISSAYYDGWTAQIPDDGGSPSVLEQPRSIERFDATQFRWVGGDNWTDNPTVTVEQQQSDGSWQPYADQSGEVQVFLDKPVASGSDHGVSELAGSQLANRTGSQAWHWRASFEAFDAYPRADVQGGQVPSGTYRFVVNGHFHAGGAVQPYQLDSAPFTVSPWTGITASDPQWDKAAGTVSFRIDPIVYPRLPSAAGRAGIAFYADDQGGTPGHSLICKTCTFRPWATSGDVASAQVQVTSPGGGHTWTVPASYDQTTDRWVANVPSGQGLVVQVPVGGIKDTYGEVNGQPLDF